jgi:hypothetical protein
VELIRCNGRLEAVQLSREVLIRDEALALRHEQIDQDAMGDVLVDEVDTAYGGGVDNDRD